jgi:hypothetical protein
VSTSRFPILRGLDVQQSRVQDNVNSVLGPVAQALQNTPIMGGPLPTMTAPSLLAGLVNFNIIFYAPMSWHIDALGYVHLGGGVVSAAGAAANTVAFVLPIQARPKYVRDFAVEGTGSTAQFVEVLPNGNVVILLAIAAGGYCTFDNVIFLAGA